MNIHWYWLLVGLVPYTIKRQKSKNEQMLMLKALFWRLTIHWANGHSSWDLFIPFIEHVQQ